jgi:hypothetical protein
VAEWLKAPVSKTGIPVNPVSRVRISPCPYLLPARCLTRVFASSREKRMLGRVAEWFKAHAWKVCVR